MRRDAVILAAVVTSALALVAAAAAFYFLWAGEPSSPFTSSAPQPGPLFLSALSLQDARDHSKVMIRTEEAELRSHAGYLAVNCSVGSGQLYFWFFPAEENPEEAPVLFWLSGGPGMSSMHAVFLESGPIYYEEGKLRRREARWSRYYSIVYVDSPYGTGFSTKDDADGAWINSQGDVTQIITQFLDRFFILFSDYSNRPLYLAGESYSGKYLPTLGVHLMAEKKHDFAGVILGNPWTDPRVQMQYYGDTWHSHGLIDLRMKEEIESTILEVEDLIEEKEYVKSLLMFGPLVYTRFMNHTGCTLPYNVNKCRYDWQSEPFVKYLKRTDISQSINAGPSFNHVNDLVNDALTPDIMISRAQELGELLRRGKRLLIYAGLLDIVVPTTASEALLGTLQWDRQAEWINGSYHQWGTGEDGALGYVKQAGPLWFVTVRDAGHFSPADQPAACLQMLRRFISDESFECLNCVDEAWWPEYTG